MSRPKTQQRLQGRPISMLAFGENQDLVYINILSIISRRLANMLPELTQDEFSAALDVVAGDVLSGLAIAGPPVDALDVARALGLVVAWDPSQQGRGRVVRLRAAADRAPQGSILLRPDPRPERLQWAVAHEIGETCACQVFDRLGVDPREAPFGTRETIANQLAGRLLLPCAWFADEGRQSDWDLFELKRRFTTASHELIARRMLEFSTGITITIFDHGRKTFRRGNLPGRQPPFGQLQQLAWRTAHEHSRATELTDHRCRARARPVHEPDWKREIVLGQWQTGEDCDEAG